MMMSTSSTTSSPLEQRPTLFCVHALGASSREFGALAALLADEFEVVALDLPGFGERATASAVGLDDMVALVTRKIRSHGSSRWMLVGHSMGGKVASLVAAHTLEGDAPLFGLAGVVLLAGSPPSPEPMDDDRRASMLAWAASGPLSAEAAREFVDANVGAPLSAADDALMLDDLRRTSPAAWTAWLETSSRDDRAPDVGTLPVPALIVSGGADGDLAAPAQRDLNGPVYPRATFVDLPGAGHLLPLERPAEVAQNIRDFWHEHASRGPAVPLDTARSIASTHTSARTRGILARRSLADDPHYAPAALTDTQVATLRTLADLVVPQRGTPIDLAARLDAQLASGAGDGWRHASLPADIETYRLALDALAGVARLEPAEQREHLAAIADGRGLPTTGSDSSDTGASASASLDASQLEAWFEDARADLVRLWLAHPATMARVGFDGFANGGDDERKQGFTLTAATTPPALPTTALPTTDDRETTP